MSKYICSECYEVFDEDEIVCWEEKHNLEHGPYEKWIGSPCCGVHYTEAKICDCCGEYITTDKYIEVDDKNYCWDCIMIKELFD